MVASANPLLPGDMVAGRYRIERQIGQGGFGAVFRATQVNIGREVALKMLLPELLANDEGLQRFQREAQLAQRLEHPNTVRLLDFGQSDNGAPFIAFELLRGESMDQALAQQGRFSAGRVARIASQVLKSLMEAHTLGIVHRDIKPPNIFLCTFQGESDYVKVLDFGIAKTTAATATSAGLTKAGHVVGTPQYMPPEHLLGQATSPPADLYALGLVMAEALTGQMVFRGVPTDVCLMQISPDPVPLSAMVLQSPLGPVILRATQKALERRYGSAAEMLQHLDTIVRQNGGDLDRGSIAGASPISPSGAPLATAAQATQAAAFDRRFDPPADQPPDRTLLAARPMPASLPPLPTSSPIGLHPANRRSPGVIIAVIALFLLAFGAGFGFFLFARTSTNGREGDRKNLVAKDPDDAPKKHGKKANASFDDGHDDNDDDPSNSLALSSLKKRAEAAGYTVVSETQSKSPGMSVRGLTLQLGKDYGVVYVYAYDDPSLAKASETAFASNKQAASTRVGNQIVMAMMNNDHAKSKDLLDVCVP